MQRRLDVTITCGERGAAAPEGSGYPDAEALIADLRRLETGLRDARCRDPADLLVRPVRREVETFRFSTFRLDIRENAARTNAALAALARTRHGGPAAPAPGAGPAWRAWLQAELTRPLRPGHTIPDLGPAETETLGMFGLIREMRDQLDREAIGSFVLSMTHDTDAVLGCYLLAKEAGLFADAAAIESCTLPIVPLFDAAAFVRLEFSRMSSRKVLKRNVSTSRRTGRTSPSAGAEQRASRSPVSSVLRSAINASACG